MRIRTVTRLVLAALLAALPITGSALPAAATSGPMTITTDTTLTEDQVGPITVGADGITLDCAGHRVTGPGFAGIFLPGRTGVTVENCYVTGFQLGFRLSSGSANTLTDNVAEADFEGIRLEESFGNVLQGNRVAGNGELGIQVVDSFGNKFLQNVAQGNFQGIGGGHGSNIYTGNRATNNRNNGFHFGGTADVISRNLAEGNFNGFWFDAEANSTVTDNTATANLEHGIGLATGSSGNLVSRNTARNNGGIGFVALNSNGNTFVRNRADANAAGFSSIAASNRFDGNTATRSRFDGFTLSGGAANNDVVGNTAMDNGAQGFALYSAGAGNIVSNNTSHGNGMGFEVADSAGNTLAENTASENVANGYFMLSAGQNTLTGNASRENGGDGYLVSQSSANRFAGNTAVENAQDGFSLQSSENNSLTQNSALSNIGVGFELFPGSTGNLLDGNVGRENGLDAEDDNPAGSNQWTNNTFGTCNPQVGC